MPRSAQSQTNSPLTPEEKRQILLQLLELRSCRESVRTYEAFVERDRELDAKEKSNYERTIEIERSATALAQERAKFYEDAFRAVTKKPGGFGCVLKKIFTIGLARCK